MSVYNGLRLSLEMVVFYPTLNTNPKTCEKVSPAKNLKRTKFLSDAHFGEMDQGRAYQGEMYLALAEHKIRQAPSIRHPL